MPTSPDGFPLAALLQLRRMQVSARETELAVARANLERCTRELDVATAAHDGLAQRIEQRREQAHRGALGTLGAMTTFQREDAFQRRWSTDLSTLARRRETVSDRRQAAVAACHEADENLSRALQALRLVEAREEAWNLERRRAAQRSEELEAEDRAARRRR